MSCSPPAWFQGMSQGGRGKLSPPPADWAHEVTTVYLLHGKDTFKRQTKPRRWDGAILGPLDNPPGLNSCRKIQSILKNQCLSYISFKVPTSKRLLCVEVFCWFFNPSFLKNSGFPFRFSQHP